MLRNLFTPLRPIGVRNASTLFSRRQLTQSVLKPGLLSTPIKSKVIVSNSIQQRERFFHTTLPSTIRNEFRPPNFNRGPVGSTSGLLFRLVPDGLKALFVVLGVSSFILFVAGPLLIITVPPLVIGAYLYRKVYLKKKQTEMKERWKNLLETHLTYKGSELDKTALNNFTINRIIAALQSNEENIIEGLGIELSEQQHHSFEDRFVLGDYESIDQDFQISQIHRIEERISVISMGLYDTDADNRFNRIGTVIITLKPRLVTDLLDITNLQQDAVIEVRPLWKFKKPIILNSKSHYVEPPLINIKAKRTTSYRD